VTIKLVGRVCARRGCGRPHWKDGLCASCWRWEREAGERGIPLADLLSEKSAAEGDEAAG
jgi:hypothetical protein